MRSLNPISRIAILAIMFVAANVYASADYYLKIDGIKGERARIVRCDNGKCPIDNLAPGTFTVTVCDAKGNPIVENFKLTCTFTPAEIRESPTKSSTGSDIRESPTKASTSPLAAGTAEVVSPRDAASGQASGKRQHKPLVITKEIDKSTPLLKLSTPTGEDHGIVVRWVLEVRVDRIEMK